MRRRSDSASARGPCSPRGERCYARANSMVARVSRPCRPNWCVDVSIKSYCRPLLGGCWMDLVLGRSLRFSTNCKLPAHFEGLIRRAALRFVEHRERFRRSLQSHPQCRSASSCFGDVAAGCAVQRGAMVVSHAAGLKRRVRPSLYNCALASDLTTFDASRCTNPAIGQHRERFDSPREESRIVPV